MDSRVRSEPEPGQLRKNFRKAVIHQLKHQYHSVAQNSIDDLYLKLEIAFKNGVYHVCIELCEKIFKIVPDHGLTMIHYGRSLFHLREYQKALNIITECTVKFPEFFFLWVHRGDCNYELERYDQAIEDYNTSLMFEPKNPAVYDKMARCYYAKGYVLSAHEYINTAIRMDKKNETPMIHKALFYEHSNDIPRAIEQYKKVIRKFPTNEYAMKKFLKLSRGQKEQQLKLEQQYKMAVNIVYRTGRVSTALLQRTIKIGYARAALLVDMMEKRGVCGPANGNNPRKIYKRRR